MLHEIAVKHGFSNSKALAKAFEKTYGMLPSEYRKKNEKGMTRDVVLFL